MAVPHGIDRSGAAGGTGAQGLIGSLNDLADPNADRILFWDDSAGDLAWMTPSNGTGISGTSIGPKDFGAVGDGVTDDTTALNNFFAAVASGKNGRITAGTYKFTSALTPFVGSGINIVGEGPASILQYGGASTTPGDLITIGDGTTTYTDVSIRGFVIGSSTTLTSGRAFRIRKCSNVEFDVIVNGAAGQQGKLYEGVWFDQSSLINLHSSQFYCINKNIIWSAGVELHCNHAYVKGQTVGGHGSGTGIHVGGGCGGFYSEDITQLLNDIGLLIDTTITGTGNTQFFLNSGTFDTNQTASVKVDDSSVNTLAKVLYMNGWFASSTAVGAAGHGLVVTNWAGGDIHIGSGVFKNHTGDGIKISDNTVRLVIGRATTIADNGAYGVESTVALTIYSDALPENNVSGNYHTNITLSNLRYGPLAVSQAPGSRWAHEIDDNVNQFTIPNGSNATIAAGAGAVMVANPDNGHVAVYLVGGAGAVRLGTTGASWVAPTTTPGAGETSVTFDGASAYRIYNNYGSQQSFKVMLLRVKIGI